MQVNKVKPEAANVKANQKKDEATEEEQKNLPWTSEECLAQMLQTNKFIQDVSVPHQSGCSCPEF